jgi:hypothetical protein
MSDRNREFSLTLSRSSTATPEDILERIKRPATWPEWVPEINSTESQRSVVGPGDNVEGRAEMLGFRVNGRAHVTEVTHRLFVQDVVIGVRIVARYSVEPTDDGSVIHHELIVSAPRGPMGRVLTFFLRGRLRAMQRRLLHNLSVQQ